MNYTKICSTDQQQHQVIEWDHILVKLTVYSSYTIQNFFSSLSLAWQQDFSTTIILYKNILKFTVKFRIAKLL